MRLRQGISVLITTSTILFSGVLLSLQASAKPTPTGSSANRGTFSPENRVQKGDFVQQINEQYLKLKQSIEKPVQNLSTDFNQGLQGLTQEIQSQINNTIGSLGIPDIIKVGKEIENTISSGTKTDILQLDARIQGRNGRQEWNRQFTREQSGSLLGIEGQKVMAQASEIAQSATDTAINNAQEAQGDYITQEVMKKIATQNAQSVKILQLVQTSLQEQTQLAASANVNLTDISENLTLEQRRKQNEKQGTINAIYRNAAFADGFFSSNK